MAKPDAVQPYNRAGAEAAARELVRRMMAEDRRRIAALLAASRNKKYGSDNPVDRMASTMLSRIEAWLCAGAEGEPPV